MFPLECLVQLIWCSCLMSVIVRMYVCAVACLCICACEQQSEKCSGDTIYSCFLQLVENCQAYLLLCAARLQCLLLSTAL